MIDRLDQQLGQLDHDRRRTVAGVDLPLLMGDRFLDLRMSVTVQHRAPATHQIEIAVPVDVGEPGTVGVSHELRRTLPQERATEMAVHSARDHPLRPGNQTLVL